MYIIGALYICVPFDKVEHILNISDIFNRRKQDTYGYYDNFNQEEKTEKLMKFSVFVGVAVALVVLVFAIIFFVNMGNNSLKKFNSASVRNFESGGFEYHVTAGIDDKTHMDYMGAIEFDLDTQMIESSYHATYENYEYDSVTYAHGADAFSGSYYGGKWSVDSFTNKALDFFSFYRSYEKGELDAGAAVRFTGMNDTFNAVQLQYCLENIMKELSGTHAQDNILCQSVQSGENGTTVTFRPKNDKVAEIILSNISPAFTSAREFEKFKKLIESNTDNLSQTQTEISFTISRDRYLTDIHLAHTVDSKCYKIDVEMSNFGEAQVEIPESFMTATGKE